MPPLIELESCFTRSSEARPEELPRRTYMVICEGENTEINYFRALFAKFEREGLPKNVRASVYGKTGGDKSSSNPNNLLKLAEKQMQDDDFQDGDRVVIVFDADIYRHRDEEYKQLLDECNEKGVIPCVTFPSFELFLLLHKRGAAKSIVAPHREEIFGNRKESNQYRYVGKLFHDEFGMNPKTNPSIGKLAEKYEIAIEEERHLNQDCSRACECLTSNIGKFISRLLNE